jgi:drug/metabolite transporter (DMT)-like permease
MSRNRKAILLALLAVTLWSTAATAFKISLRELDFVNLLLYSSVVSTFVLLVILLVKKEDPGILNRKALFSSAFMGFLNPFLYYMILLKAYSLLPAQIAQPLNYLWPVMLSLLAVPLLGQRLKPAALIALVVSFTGVAVISQQGQWFHINKEDVPAVLLAAGSSVIWALYWIFNMRDKRNDAPRLFLNFLFGTLYIIIYILLFDEFQSPFSESGMAAVYVGIFEMGFTFFLWMTALQYASAAAKVSNLVFLSPFISLIFIHFVLGEEIYITTLPGIILILGGIIVSGMIKDRKKAAK